MTDEIRPFTGFTRDTLRFLSGLRRNNNREWFESHRAMYDEHVMAPSKSFVVAMGRRLRRNYVGIYAVLLGSWFVVLMTHPTPTTSLSEIIARASVGPIPGMVIFIGMMSFYAGLAALGVYSYWESRRVKRLPAGHPERMAFRHHEDH